MCDGLKCPFVFSGQNMTGFFFFDIYIFGKDIILSVCLNIFFYHYSKAIIYFFFKDFSMNSLENIKE